MNKLHLAAVFLTLPLFFSLLSTSCGSNDGDELHNVVDSFATRYFNWQFPASVRFVTDDSKKWLSYAASQVTQEDVDSLRAMVEGAKIEIEEIEEEGDTAKARVKVDDYLEMDTIGGTPRMVSEDTYILLLVRENGIWKIHLNEQPRHIK